MPAADVVQHAEVGDAAEAGAGPKAQHRAVCGVKQENKRTGENKQFHGFGIINMLARPNVLLDS